MPLIETKGAASAQGFGEFAKTGVATYIEDVFSTWLYTGNGSTQTITNNIDTTTYGGLVWIKARTNAASGDNNHELYDTARGVRKVLNSNQQSAENTLASNGLTAFGTTGFTVSDDSFGSYGVNGPNGRTFVSWTFRKQPKFFDVVTYTGNGSSLNRAIAHNLGSVPGCIIVKSTSNSSTWVVWHRGNTSYGTSPWYNLSLNTTDAGNNALGIDTTPTSSVFYVRADPPFNSYQTNINGQTYVAYLFAHNAGGFGLTGTDNVISCGSVSGAGTTVNLGYEPQWILAKRTDTTGNWYIDDNMREWPAAPGNDNPLLANSSAAEPTGYAGFANITSTGFTNNFNGDYIYIAIRRGPMKTPTTGTSVYGQEAFTGTGTTKSVTTLSAPDAVWLRAYRDFTNANTVQVYDRLRGNGARIRTGLTNAEGTNANFLQFNNQMLATVGNDSETNGSGALNMAWSFRRAPGFFDVVCYTGTGSPMTISHNLGVSPEFAFTKSRNATGDWDASVFLSGFTDNVASGFLNGTNAFSQGGGDSYFYPASSTTFTRSSNVNGRTYVAYLFATCPGVSKVGSYTGTGNTLQIDCGFTGGARFVLIKRTNSTGDWYVWDSARGIVSGNDPYLLLNSTAAEVTNTDYVDTYSAGFEISSTAPADINANGGTYIFLAVS